MIKLFLGIFSAVFLLVGFKAIADENVASVKVARILCSNSLGFETLRTDAVTSYVPPSIETRKISDQSDNFTLQDISEPVLSSGGPLDLDFYFVGQNSQMQKGLYQAQFDIPKRLTQSKLVLSLPKDLISKEAVSILGRWALPVKNYAYSSFSKTLVVPLAHEVKIYSQDANTSLNVEAAFNPLLSPTGQWLKLDFFSSSVKSISSKLFSTQSSEILTLPASLQNHQLALRFISDSKVIWQEVAINNPQIVRLKMASMTDLKKGNSQILKTWTLEAGLRNKPVWLGYSGANSDFWVAEMNETYETVAGTAELKEGHVALTQFSDAGAVLSQKNTNYSDSLVKLSKTLPINSRFLSSGIYFDQQIIFSTGSFGGTTTVNLLTGEWTTQATLGTAYMCNEPQVIAEGDGL